MRRKTAKKQAKKLSYEERHPDRAAARRARFYVPLTEEERRELLTGAQSKKKSKNTKSRSGKSSSVWTISGGLPGQGKRR